MKKVLIFLLFLNITASSIYAQSSQVDKFILSEMSEVGIQGMSVAVIKSGRILKMQSYGIANVEWNVPVTNQTLFPMASVSKLFTSSLVMDMVKSNEINLESSIASYIKDAPYAWEDIKVKHLLSHRSGIKWLKEMDHNATTAEAIEALKDSTLMFKPGTKECYASSDYTVLKYIIESTTNKTFESLIKERVFNKYNMKSCGFDMEKRKGCEQTMIPLRNKTQVYLGKGNDMKVYKYFYPRYSYCAGGLWMNITDASSWIVALDNGYIIDYNNKSKLYEKVKTEDNTPSNYNIYGWSVKDYQNKTCAGHSGGPAVAEIISFPHKRLTVIVFTNQRNILPYLAKTIASFYISDITKPNGRKTLEF